MALSAGGQLVASVGLNTPSRDNRVNRESMLKNMGVPRAASGRDSMGRSTRDTRAAKGRNSLGRCTREEDTRDSCTVDSRKIVIKDFSVSSSISSRVFWHRSSPKTNSEDR